MMGASLPMDQRQDAITSFFVHGGHAVTHSTTGAAMRCQSNAATPATAFGASSASFLLWDISAKAAANSDTENGSKNTPASPITSGKLDVIDASTGFPRLMASSAGIPNPS